VPQYKLRVAIVLAAFIGLMSGLIFVAYEPVAPIAKDATNPLYFTYKGSPLYLVGHQNFRPNVTQATGRDMEAIMDVEGDLDKYLDYLAERNMNNIRLWPYFTGDPSNPVQGYSDPPVWQRTGPGTGNDGLLKYDLTLLNQEYFDRVSEICAKAEDRDIIITILFWDVYGMQGNRWTNNPLNPDNNINNIDADSNNNGRGLDGFLDSPRSGAATAIQTAFEEKMIDTVNPYPNVIYELINEYAELDLPEAVITRAAAYEAGKDQQHMIMLSTGGLADNGTYPHDFDKTEMLASSADVLTVAPGASGWGTVDTTPPLASRQGANRPLVADMDHIDAGLRDNAYFWRVFTRGYHYVLYESAAPYVDLGWEGYMTDATEDLHRQNMSYAGSLANTRFENLSNMIPDDGTSVADTTFVMADVADEYLVFSPLSSRFDVKQLLNATNYDFEWFNLATGTVVSTGSILTSGTTHTFSPPGTEYVLYLRRQGL